MVERFKSPGTPPTPRQREVVEVLIEEGAEVVEILADIQHAVANAQKRGTKALRFGLDEVQPGQPRSNAERLGGEIGELLCVIDLAVKEGIIPADAVKAGREHKGRQLARFLQTDPEPSSAPDDDDDVTGRIGINFVYVRAYPDAAARWLAAAATASDIPEDLRPILAAPLGGILTREMPNIADSGVCGDDLFRWGHRFPGSHNDAPTDEEYCTILDYLDEGDRREASEAARTALPADHPWCCTASALT